MSKEKTNIIYPSLGISKGSQLGGEIAEVDLWRNLAHSNSVNLHLILPKHHEQIDYPNTSLSYSKRSVKYSYERNILDLISVIKLLKTTPNSLLYIHSPAYFLLATIAKIFFKAKVFSRFHHHEPNDKILTCIHKITANFSDVISVPSQYSKQEFLEVLGNKNSKKLQVLYNGIELPPLSPQYLKDNSFSPLPEKK